MTAVVSNRVLLLLFLFICIIRLSFPLPHADACFSRLSDSRRDSEGLKVTSEFLRTLEGDKSSDPGAGIDARGVASVKLSIQRTASGPLVIVQTDPKGRFVMLENDANTGVKQNVDLYNWKLQRQVDNHRMITYKFGHVVMKPSKTLKIWAGGFSAEAGTNDLVVAKEDNWGTGDRVVTALVNDKNEEKASHIQKILHS